MSHAIVRSESPEEREYARYLVEIDARKRRAAELQADLETLKLTLGRFEAEYHARVGVLFVELDRVRLAIAEYERRIALLTSQPKIHPEDMEREVSESFTHRREEIDADEETTRRYVRQHQRESKRPEIGEAEADELKQADRELAERFHPDLARTEEERQRRAAIMQRINAAFRDRDVTALGQMMHEAEFEDPSFEQRSIGEKLVRAIREVARLDDVIAELTRENALVTEAGTYRLWQRHEAGETVLVKLETDLARDLATDQDQLSELISTYQTSGAGASALSDSKLPRIPDDRSLVFDPKAMTPLIERGLGYLEMAPSRSSEWPMFRGNLARTGVMPGQGPRAEKGIEVRWRFTTGGEVVTSPAMGEGVLFFGSYDAYVYSLDAETGHERWRFETGMDVDSSPAVANGVVYIGGGNDVYALDADTGAQRWRVSTEGSVFSSPAVLDEVVYVGSGNGNVYALDARTGTESWSFATRAAVLGSLAFADGYAYVNSWNGYTYALDVATSLERWRFATAANSFSSPAVANGCIYVGSDDCHVFALDAKNGEERWRFSAVGGRFSSPPAVAGGLVLVDSDDKILYAIDAASGVERWRLDTGAEVMSSSAVVAGAVYIGIDYNICALDLASGKERWHFATDGYVESSPIVVDGNVYVGSQDYNVYALTGATQSLSIESKHLPVK